MGGKKQEIRNTTRRKIYLPEERPESRAYRVAGKTQYAGQAFGKKQAEDKAAADKGNAPDSPMGKAAGEMYSPPGKAPKQAVQNISKNSKNTPSKNAHRDNSSRQENAQANSETVKDNSEAMKTAAKVSVVMQINEDKNASSSATPTPSPTPAPVRIPSEQARARADELQRRMTENVEMSRREKFSDEIRPSNNMQARAAKAEFAKLTKDSRQAEKALKKEESRISKYDRQITKAEKLMKADKAGLLGEVISKGQAVAEVYGEVTSAAAKENVGESAAAMAFVPGKLLGRAALKKAEIKLKRDFHKKYTVKQGKKIEDIHRQKKDILEKISKSNPTEVELKKASKELTKLTKEEKKITKGLNKGEKTLGNGSSVIKSAAAIAATAESSDNAGEAAVNVMTAVPKQMVKEKAVNTVTDIAYKSHQKNMEAKRARLKAQRAKAEKRAENIRKEHIARDMKVNIYKSAHGITSKTASAVQNAKAALTAAQQAAAGIVHTVQGAGAAIAAASSVLPVIMVVIVIIIIIVVLFSWIQPHEAEQYDEAGNTWKTVQVDGDDKAILQGYIKYISDYFDKKQLEILEVVDINFGGFTPDRYNYPREDDRNGVLNFLNKKEITYSKTNYYYSGTVKYYEYAEYRYPPIEEHTAFVKSKPIFRKEYYKTDEESGYEVKTEAGEAQSEAIYININLDIQGYYDKIYDKQMLQWEERGGFGTPPKKITFDNGTICAGASLSEMTVTQYENGVAVKTVPAFEFAQDFILNHYLDKIDFTTTTYVTIPAVVNNKGEVVTGEHTEPREVAFTKSISADNSFLSLSQDTIEETSEDKQYVFTNYIWNLNEFQNRWIKLTDECDYEHIIAMAAIKKFQDITADGFDSDSYDFVITDEDLEYCLDKLYEFNYGYRSGNCAHSNCQEIKVKNSNGSISIKYVCFGHTKHLVGNVVNYQAAGGIDFILNRVLSKNLGLDMAYKKDIYEMYVEYIYSILGTSTKLPDYENDKNAQLRLLHMHEAQHGKKPGNAVKNLRCNGVTIAEHPGGHVALGSYVKVCRSWESYVLNLSWDAPEPEEYSEGKFTEISGYKVCLYARSGGQVKEVARTTDTTCEVDLLDMCFGWTLKRIVTDEIMYDISEMGNPIERNVEKEIVSQGQIYVVVIPYNSCGDGKRSENLYVPLNP